MHVRDQGSGRPLVLLHGWSCHGGFFAPQFTGLAGVCRLIAPDLPGHGATGATGDELTIEAAAAACADMMAAREFNDIVLVGWSMGAHVALALLAGAAAARVAHLVIVDMSPKVLNDAHWRLGLKGGLDAAHNEKVCERIETSWPTYARHVARRVFAEGHAPDADLLAFAETEIARADPALIGPVWSSLTAQDFRVALPRIACPVTLAYGGRSALYEPAVARWQAERIPAARLQGFPASGHAPHLEEPGAFNGMLATILAGAAAA